MSNSVQSLAEGCLNGNYYEPLMHFKTVFNRKINGRLKNSEKAIVLLCDGLTACVSAGNVGAPAAADLASQVFILFESFEMKHDDTSLKMIESISKCFGGLEPNDIQSQADVHSTHKQFLLKSFTWSRDKKTAQGDVSTVYGDFLHQRLGLIYKKEASLLSNSSQEEKGAALLKAYKHLVNIRGVNRDSYPIVAQHLVEVVDAIAEVAPKSEYFLFVTRCFLQVLCRTKPHSDQTYAVARIDAVNTAATFLTYCCAKAEQSSVAASPEAGFCKSFASLLGRHGTLNAAKKNEAEENEDSSVIPSIDIFLKIQLPILKLRDPKLEELTIAVANEHKATVALKKVGGGGGLLGALFGGGGGGSSSPK